ncbi:MAG: hypothetical protein U0414_07265 [Polyangiaceae bacterium]
MSVPQIFESDLVTPPPQVETVVAVAVGTFNACDAWFRIPSTGWATTTTFRFYARLNDARVLLKEVDLGDVHKTTDALTSTVSGIVVSVRGRPVTGFELSVLARTALTGAGRFTLQAWTGADNPRVIGAGSVASQPAAEESLVAVRSGSVPVHVAGDSAGRILVAGAGVASAPSGGVMTVQGPWAAGPTYAIATPATVKPSLATASTTTNLLTLRSSATKRVEIRRILLSYNGVAAAAAADGRIQVMRTASAPTGGNAVTPVSFDGSQSAATATALAPNPTAIVLSPTEVLLSLTVRCDDKDKLVLEPDVLGQPIVLRTSQETLCIRFTNDVAVASQTFSLQATVHFVEI